MKDYKDQKEYKIVEHLIREMDNDGTIVRFQGACLPASEIIQAILHSRGVKSRMLECTALVANAPENGNSVHFVGFDSLVALTPNETDTHFIVLVEAEKPFIIDASIGYKMGNPRYVVVSELSVTDPEIIAEASFIAASVTYRIKKNLRYQNIHQKTLVEKIEAERKTQTDISNLYNIVKISIAIGAINMVANTLLIVLKATFP